MDGALPKLKKDNELLWAIHIMVRLMGLRDSEIDASQTHWISLHQEGRMEKMELRIIKRAGEKGPKRSECVVGDRMS